MTYTVMLFVTRSANLTSEEFKDHYENTHIPLAYSLTADSWPTQFKRQYLARINRKGFGTPQNPDRPLLTLRGEMLEVDCDCIAELSFPDERRFQGFYSKIYEKEIAAILARDEEKFLMPGMTKVVVVGETCSTNANGCTTSITSCVPRNDTSDSEGSMSEQS
ncbi:hypothetical protein ACN47E_005328 [Coniothyrium glycines]